MTPIRFLLFFSLTAPLQVFAQPANQQFDLTNARDATAAAEIKGGDLVLTQGTRDVAGTSLQNSRANKDHLTGAPPLTRLSNVDEDSLQNGDSVKKSPQERDTEEFVARASVTAKAESSATTTTPTMMLYDPFAPVMFSPTNSVIAQTRIVTSMRSPYTPSSGTASNE